MRVVYESMVVTDADFIAMMIRDAGIQVATQNAGANLMTEIIPIFAARVEVRDEDFDAAMEIVKKGVELLKTQGAPPDDEELNKLAESAPPDPEV